MMMVPVMLIMSWRVSLSTPLTRQGTPDHCRDRRFPLFRIGADCRVHVGLAFARSFHASHDSKHVGQKDSGKRRPLSLLSPGFIGRLAPPMAATIPSAAWQELMLRLLISGIWS